jgi:aminoglycoside phosphotransferase (APT) family kinase protein
MRSAGFAVTHEIGRGLEGVVGALDAVRVVMGWDRRPRPVVERLRTFYDAVEAAIDHTGASLAVPRILEIREDGGFVVTVQRRLGGQPVTPARPGPVLDVLEVLARVDAHPDLAVLPVPDGEPPFAPDVPFGESLAALVLRRAPLVGGLADGAAERMAAALRALTPVPPRLVHGDLGAAHVLCEDGRPGGLLDFGYISTVGDPAFDAAVAASLQDMFGRGSAAATAAMDALVLERFGYDPAVLVLYRAAYGLVTASCLAGHPGQHLDWCLALVDAWATPT